MSFESDRDFIAEQMASLGITPTTTCAKCLRTFAEHCQCGGLDCGEFTPCIEAPTEDP